MTTKQFKQLKELTQSGSSQPQIAKQLGVSVETVRHYQNKLGVKARGMPGRPKGGDSQYTLYDKRGNVRAFGTAQECADALGVKKQYIYWLACVSRKTGVQKAVREE